MRTRNSPRGRGYKRSSSKSFSAPPIDMRIKGPYSSRWCRSTFSSGIAGVGGPLGNRWCPRDPPESEALSNTAGSAFAPRPEPGLLQIHESTDLAISNMLVFRVGTSSCVRQFRLLSVPGPPATVIGRRQAMFSGQLLSIRNRRLRNRCALRPKVGIDGLGHRDRIDLGPVDSGHRREIRTLRG